MDIITLTDGTKRMDYNTKETAAFIRAAVAKAFPGVKFSIRTKYGSCYSATFVSWTDGPTTAEVERITDAFSSKTFDGSDDSTHYHSHDIDGMKVQYSGWINTHRDLSPAFEARLAAAVALRQRETRYGHPLDDREALWDLSSRASLRLDGSLLVGRYINQTGGR